MFFTSENCSKICELIKQFNNDVLFVINELGKILNEFGTGTSGADGSTDFLELLDGVETFFGILMTEIVEEGGDFVFLFHSSILEN